jgi:hypothetical protein
MRNPNLASRPIPNGPTANESIVHAITLSKRSLSSRPLSKLKCHQPNINMLLQLPPIAPIPIDSVLILRLGYFLAARSYIFIG